MFKRRLENHLSGLLMLQETELRPLIEIQEFGQLLKKPTDFHLREMLSNHNVLFGAVLLHKLYLQLLILIIVQ